MKQRKEVVCSKNAKYPKPSAHKNHLCQKTYLVLFNLTKPRAEGICSAGTHSGMVSRGSRDLDHQYPRIS